MKKKSISIFGVTGSVGSSTIELLRQRKDEFEVIALTCNKNIDLLLELSQEFQPKSIAVSDENFFLELKKSPIKSRETDGWIFCLVGSPESFRNFVMLCREVRLIWFCQWVPWIFK